MTYCSSLPNCFGRIRVTNKYLRVRRCCSVSDGKNLWSTEAHKQKTKLKACQSMANTGLVSHTASKMRFMEVLSLSNSGTVLVRLPASISVCNRCTATLILFAVKPLSLHSIIGHQLHHACSQANHSMQRASNLVRDNLQGTIEHYLHPNNLKVRCTKHNVSTEASCNPSDCHESVFLLLAKCHTEMQG